MTIPHLNHWQLVLMWTSVITASLAYLRFSRPSRLRRRYTELRREHKAALRTISRALRTVDDAIAAGGPDGPVYPTLFQVQMTLEHWRYRLRRVIPRESQGAG